MNATTEEQVAPVKLDWNWDTGLDCEVAFYKGYRIKAERDDSPSNPFEDWDGNWPIMVYHGRNDGFTSYDKTKGVAIDAVLDRFTDAQLIHDQIAIASAFDTKIMELTCYEEEPTRYCHDADVLRKAFEDELGNWPDSKRLALFEELYKLLGIPAYQTTSCGHCQGDWAEVLVVATPEAQLEFGRTEKSVRQQALTELAKGAVRTDATTEVTAKQIADIWEKDLEGTADLYGDWAWGNVYGYVIEKLVRPTTCFECDAELPVDAEAECLDCLAEIEEEWEDIEHGSCWGYYGDDHDKSGLEGAALDAIPDDEPVRDPDTLQEAA